MKQQDILQLESCPATATGEHEWENKVIANTMNIPIYKHVCKRCGMYKEKDFNI